MTRRLKLYREQNPEGSNLADFFTKVIGAERVKIVEQGGEEHAVFEDLKTFIESEGKPCCLNMITDADNKFLR